MTTYLSEFPEGGEIKPLEPVWISWLPTLRFRTGDVMVLGAFSFEYYDRPIVGEAQSVTFRALTAKQAYKAMDVYLRLRKGGASASEAISVAMELLPMSKVNKALRKSADNWYEFITVDLFVGGNMKGFKGGVTHVS